MIHFDMRNVNSYRGIGLGSWLQVSITKIIELIIIYVSEQLVSIKQNQEEVKQEKIVCRRKRHISIRKSKTIFTTHGDDS